MSTLATHRTLTLREGSDAPVAVTVRELSVAEIRAWMAQSQEAAQALPDLVDNLLLPGVALPDLTHLSSLTAAQIETLTPSELDQVLTAAREINRHFFGLLAAVQTLASQMQSAASNGPSPA